MAINKEQVKKIVPLLDRLKALFQEEAKFMDAELADGTKLVISGELAEGSKVEIVNEDGNAPAPDGDHELKDGSVITIKDGVIASVKAKEEKPKEEDPLAMNEFKAEESFNSLKAEFDAQKLIIAEMQNKFNELLGVNKTLDNDLKLSKQIQTETFKVVQALAELPIEEPLVSKPNAMFSKESRLAQIQSTLNNLKK